MSALFFRPVATYPIRYSAPAFCMRPSRPSPHDFAPLFSLFDESLVQIERIQRQAQSQAQLKRPFNPRFDVKESKEAYSVEAEVPGFDAKDISIEFLDDGHTLQIKGKTITETRNPHQTQAVENSQTETTKSVDQTPVEKSQASIEKSHQPTVEDDVEEPANSSAAIEQPQQQQQQEVVAEASKTQEQQVGPTEDQQQDAKHWITERYSGSFSRSFKFPSKVDQEAVRASLKNGILAITLPFASKPESRRIQIE